MDLETNFSKISWGDGGFQLDLKDFSSEKTFDNKIQLSQIHVERNVTAFLGQIILSP